MFTDSLSLFRQNNVAEEDLHTWKEYTVTMMKAAVGKTRLGQRHEKIVVVPKELRQPLAGLLGENCQRFL